MSDKRVIDNAKWIIICKALQAVAQLVIGMLSARYLGPADYGLIHYAGSLVGFVVPVAQLGLNATLVREFVDEPEKEGEILGTSLVMSLLSGLFGFVMVMGFVSVANRGETETLTVCFLYSLSLLFQAMELTQYWFHYQLQAKFPAVVTLIAYFAVAAYKVYLLLAGKSVYWFAAAYAVEYGLVGLSLLGIFGKRSSHKPFRNHPNGEKAICEKSLLYPFLADGNAVSKHRPCYAENHGGRFRKWHLHRRHYLRRHWGVCLCRHCGFRPPGNTGK